VFVVTDGNFLRLQSRTTVGAALAPSAFAPLGTGRRRRAGARGRRRRARALGRRHDHSVGILALNRQRLGPLAGARGRVAGHPAESTRRRAAHATFAHGAVSIAHGADKRRDRDTQR